MTLKNTLKLVTPPILIRLAKRLSSNRQPDVYGLSGDYQNWDKALAASTGYDSELILEKTRISLLKVKKGDAAYERDSVLFDEIEYTWPVLAGLMWAAARSGGTLNVLDFGGSLGSTYFQNRNFLSKLLGVRWNIVEQPRHIEVGKAWFEDNHLHFYATITECLSETQPNIVLLSSVLQYLENPYTVLEQLMGLPIDNVIIDRTPFWAGQTDRLCVQSVPPSIYPASYPSWIFSRNLFQSKLYKNWQIMVTFDNPDKLAGPVDFIYQGVIIVRRNYVP
jgi:putative methyltransferase (TIGR04325 family)